MQEDMLMMNSKERHRKAIIEAIKNKHFTVTEAAERLQITKRQVRRILRRYEKEGDKGLIHRHRGKTSNHVCNLQLKTIILDLYQTKYKGFGPTFAAEKLTEDGYPIVAETLRLWLRKAGLFDEKRKRATYRKQRKRKEQFGELLQLDGSFHHWFGDDYPTACLMNLVDDATGTTLAILDEQETTEASMKILKKWIGCYGVPKSIYVDLKTVYVSPKTVKLNENEPHEMTVAFTHFSKACDKLGIKIIKAYSPQAKGRVERKHAVFQDRFVKELQLKNIKTIAQANGLLEKEFLNNINKKFAVAAASSQDAHRDAKLFGDLNQIFCWEYTRQIQNDWTINFNSVCYQIQRTKLPLVRPKQKIIVHQHLNGAISLWHGKNQLAHEKIDYKPKFKPYVKKGHDSIVKSNISRQSKLKSPWVQFNPSWLKPTQKRIDSQQKEVL